MFGRPFGLLEFFAIQPDAAEMDDENADDHQEEDNSDRTQGGVITAADIADYVGEFIQIRIVKPSEHTTHAIWIDEVQLTSQHDGPEEPATCGLLLD